MWGLEPAAFAHVMLLPACRRMKRGPDRANTARKAAFSSSSGCLAPRQQQVQADSYEGARSTYDRGAVPARRSDACCLRAAGCKGCSMQHAQARKPGDPGFRWHASIPQPARLDYMKRPESKVGAQAAATVTAPNQYRLPRAAAGTGLDGAPPALARQWEHPRSAPRTSLHRVLGAR